MQILHKAEEEEKKSMKFSGLELLKNSMWKFHENVLIFTYKVNALSEKNLVLGDIRLYINFRFLEHKCLKNIFAH